MSDLASVTPAEPQRMHRFVRNVVWNWSHVGLALFSSLLLSPYIIRKLGAEGYGIWSLVFSIISYYGLLDFGFRSAVVYFSARYLATGEHDKLNSLISTLTLFSSAMALLLAGLTVVLSRHADRLFKVSPGMQHTFAILILLVGLAVSLNVVFNVAGGVLEGAQRFDLVSQALIASFVVRYFGGAAMLALGFGLLSMGVLAFLAQLLLYALGIWNVLRVFPQVSLAPRMASKRVFQEAASYGIHTFAASIGSQVLDNSAPIIIGLYLPAAFVGFYNLPYRMLQYAADAVSRIGMVAAPQATELAARGRLQTVSKLAIFSNRYAFTLYMPLALGAALYGHELLRFWVGPDFAQKSLPVLHALVFGTALAQAGQFSSSTILFGLSRHRLYCYLMLLEAGLSVAGMIYVVPRYGIAGAAILGSALMVVSRGICAPALLCHYLEFPLPLYFLQIYARPRVTAVPVAVLLYWFQQHWTVHNLFQTVVLIGLAGMLFYLGALFTCVQAEHRSLLLNWLLRRKSG
jgi:O-antigen/teichoic acid export membrane protein